MAWTSASVHFDQLLEGAKGTLTLLSSGSRWEVVSDPKGIFSAENGMFDKLGSVVAFRDGSSAIVATFLEFTAINVGKSGLGNLADGSSFQWEIGAVA